MSRTDPIGQTTVDIIISKFWEMYEKKPLSQINVTDLSKACGISRGTFYQYYENVYALYYELEAEVINTSERGLSDVIMYGAGQNFEKYVEVSSNHLRDHVQNLDKFKPLLNGSESASFRKMWLESIQKNFVKMIEFSDDLPTDDRDNLTLFFSGGLLSVLSNWVLNDCREPAGNIARVATRILSKGILGK